jgi:FkbM family methyltransferase
MSSDRSLTLSLKLKKKGYDPTHVCEVGVYLPETCSVRPYILTGKKVSLVEANQVMVERIRQAFRDYPLTKVFPYAVAGQPGKVTLYNRGASTFIDSVKSPAIVNDQYTKSDKDRFEVEAKTFDQMDDGTIDVLCIDVEGAEWYVLDKLVSRPDLISVETHGKYYINPRLKEIREWMRAKGYRIWYKDKSDSVFVNPAKINVTMSESISNALYQVYLNFRRWKGIVSGRTTI